MLGNDKAAGELFARSSFFTLLVLAGRWRRDSMEAVIGTVTATGSVGVGTSSPADELDVFASAAGIHELARFGSSGGADCNSVRTYTGSGNTEIFQAGAASCFVPGAGAGDGGLRVSPGKRILLGDRNANRVLIDDVGNASQARTTGGFVKAMVQYDMASNTISQCFNSTLSGTAATAPPCGLLSEVDSSRGFAFIDFGFRVDDRFFSAVPMSVTCLANVGCFTPLLSVCTVSMGIRDASVTLTNTLLGIQATDRGNAVVTPVSVIVY